MEHCQLGSDCTILKQNENNFIDLVRLRQSKKNRKQSKIESIFLVLGYVSGVHLQRNSIGNIVNALSGTTFRSKC